ncbi:12530_t:CDS:2 [Funneliformis geosporum]|nr:12530_t:CDS:2 [Funneliformis geosporum]
MGDDPMKGAPGDIPETGGIIPKGLTTSQNLKSQKVPQNKEPSPKLNQVVKVPPRAGPGGSSEAPTSGSQNERCATTNFRCSKTSMAKKEEACILVSGPPNNTLITPKSKQRISWNQSPCQMLYNGSSKKSDLSKRDYSPNGKLSYDWGPYPIAIISQIQLTIMIETISHSGTFGATPPLGGTYGPTAIELHEHSDDNTENISSGHQLSLPSAIIQSWVGLIIALIQNFYLN